MSIGSWFRDRPQLLEKAYSASHWLAYKLNPISKKIGYERIDKLARFGERKSKELLFDCKMCGQCVLHSTGMTCPMTCPKNLRNGPCGGVRFNGHCEVIPEMKCVWVEAYERSLRMPNYGNEIQLINPPVNRRLEGTSAWVNMLTGVDQEMPKAWVGVNDIIIK
jgi:hypothetical protein